MPTDPPPVGVETTYSTSAPQGVETPYSNSPPQGLISTYSNLPLAAALLSAACAIAAASVAAMSPTDTLLCNFIHPDCLGNHWLMVWVAEQVMHGRSILHNDSYSWPVGDAPWLAGNGSEGFLYLPFQAAFGWPLGSNIYLIGILALNGMAAFALARAAGAGKAAALAAAPTARSSPAMVPFQRLRQEPR